MDVLQDIIIVGGLTCTALLWVFCAAGAMQVLWDTFGDHLESILQRIKR